MKLKDKVALIAGGGQGIGEGIAFCLAEEGADVAIADIHIDHARKVAEKVESLGRKSLAILADLTDDNQAQKTVQETVDFFGRIDVLVNNVGGVSPETLVKVGEHRAALGNEALPEFMYFNSKVWDQYYKLNLKTHVILSQAVTPHFIKQRGGNIINISSVSGRLPEPGHMPYGSMKAADISLTWSLAKALAPYNVTVNCICPGLVYTPLWEMGVTARFQMIREARAKGQELPKGIDAEDIETLTPKEFWLKYMVKPSIPLGREQTAEDMGRAVVFLVSDDAKNITGQILHVDGGLAMR
jgi:meso-butanediol dehydrogenase / (S,S)-butanediol dehydrogenase / diacetyl reductase